MEKYLTFFEQDLWYTGVELTDDEHHGKCLVFMQSFPNPLAGHTR